MANTVQQSPTTPGEPTLRDAALGAIIFGIFSLIALWLLAKLPYVGGFFDSILTVLISLIEFALTFLKFATKAAASILVAVAVLALVKSNATRTLLIGGCFVWLWTDWLGGGVPLLRPAVPHELVGSWRSMTWGPSAYSQSVVIYTFEPNGDVTYVASSEYGGGTLTGTLTVLGDNRLRLQVGPTTDSECLYTVTASALTLLCGNPPERTDRMYEQNYRRIRQ